MMLIRTESEVDIRISRVLVQQDWSIVLTVCSRIEPSVWIDNHTHSPTHYKTHTYTHTPTLYKTHTYTHPHITKPTHTHITKPIHTHPHFTKPTHIHTFTHSSNNKEGLDVIRNNRWSVGFNVGRNTDVCQCFFDKSLYYVDKDIKVHEIITATKNIHYSNANNNVMVAECENCSLVLRNSDRFRDVLISLPLSPVTCLEIFSVW
jgi:hypothetical protein